MLKTSHSIVASSSNVSDQSLSDLKRECALEVLRLYKKANAGHIGSSLSCLDILIAIIFKEMTVDDQLVLSKGHAACALYVTLAKRGWLSGINLNDFYKEGTDLAAHPPCNRKIPMIPFGTGSLGHGLPLAVGLAMSDRFTKKKHNIFTVLSEGDLNEGSTWEGLLYAGAKSISNIVAYVDANGLQGFGASNDVVSLRPLKQKLQAFNWEVVEVQNGNSLDELLQASSRLRFSEKPKCILAKTTKGAGVGFMENRLEWHYLPMSEEQYQDAVKAFRSSP